MMKPKSEKSCKLLSLHKYAIFVACCTFVLIFAGGLVTSTGSGLSVPDWPLSFGKFFPKMEGGVLFEHGHRMIAGSVGVLTMILAILLWKFESKVRVKYLGFFAVISVLLQAVLGGITVLLKLPLWVSVSHAGLAQFFFCLIVAIVAATAPNWYLLNERTGNIFNNAKMVRNISKNLSTIIFLSIVTTIAIYMQILLGAVMRHIGAGLAIPDFPLSFGHVIPPENSWTPSVIIHFAHRIGAFIVAIMVIMITVNLSKFCKDRVGSISRLRTFSISEENRFMKIFYLKLQRLAIFTHFLLFVQLFLGALTIWTGKSVVVVTSHVAVGSLLLAAMLVITLQTCHLKSVLSNSISNNQIKVMSVIKRLYQLKKPELEKSL